MAVIALPVGHGVFNYREFIKISEVSLIYAHLAVYLISRGDAAVCEPPLVERSLAHADSEVIILHPLAGYFSTYCHCQFLSLVPGRELMPFVDIELCKFPVCVKFIAVGAFHSHIHTVCLPIGRDNGKIERSDLHRYGHANVVGKNGRHGGHLFHVIRLVAASQKSQGYQQGEYLVFHHKQYLSRLEV